MLTVAGQIKEVKTEVKIYLTRAKILYKPDFECVPADGSPSYFVEAKGHADQKWPIKKKLWKHYGPGTLHIYTGHFLNPKLSETIVPIPFSS